MWFQLGAKFQGGLQLGDVRVRPVPGVQHHFGGGLGWGGGVQNGDLFGSPGGLAASYELKLQGGGVLGCPGAARLHRCTRK